MFCSGCMYFVPKGENNEAGIGRCRRHAPTMSGFPVVFPGDWCGDHKIDENKIDDSNCQNSEGDMKNGK